MRGLWKEERQEGEGGARSCAGLRAWGLSSLCKPHSALFYDGDRPYRKRFKATSPGLQTSQSASGLWAQQQQAQNWPSSRKCGNA